MNTDQAITRVTDEIRKLMTGATSSEASAKMKIGRKIAAVKSDEKRYGKYGVKLIAKALSCTAANLYSYATVAEAWDNDVFSELLRRTNSKGVPLSFSHFIEIAKARPAKRPILIERAIEEALSVRMVNRMVRLGGVTKIPAQVACQCIDKVNAELAKQNEILVLSLRVTGASYTVVATTKHDPTLRTKRHTLIATFCPFCGKKYPR